MICHQTPSNPLRVFCFLTLFSILSPILVIVASDDAHAQGILSWNTFRGGAGFDKGNAIAADRHGNTYLTGDFKVGTSAYAFVSKIDPRGVKVWDKILGSSTRYDYGNDVAVDGSGKVYVVGGSGATWGSPARAHSGGGMDAFVAILDPDGSLLWHTFLGTNGNDDVATAVAFDADGYIYVAGNSTADWGLGAITKRPYAGGTDLFALKIAATTPILTFWHTFMGSTVYDGCYGITRDKNGNVYVTGTSSASWGDPKEGFSGDYDALVVKLNGNGDYQWHTFIGSGVFDSARAIAADTTGNTYISGVSGSSWGVPLNAHQGLNDAFAAKLNSAGNRLWNTFMGSTDYDEGYGIALDSRRNVYVTGYSSASWGNPQNSFSGDTDAFVAQLNPFGVRLWHTFMGGSGIDMAVDIAVNGGGIVIAGLSGATWGTPVTAHHGARDAFAAKFRTGTALPPILLLLTD